jgi:xanthine dehydrogenase accessory factor
VIPGELATTVAQLTADCRPFVLATVVRARRPTSVRPGDTAVVLADGTIDGFVGGVCAQSSVRLHGLRALETGEPLLLRLVPGDPEAAGETEDGGVAGTLDGAVVEHNPCLSGGALEIFLDPHLPAARVAVIGDSPIARALERVALAAGYDCRRTESADAAGDDEDLTGAAAVIVASHGNGEEEHILARALSAGVPYVALVASPRRGAAVRSELGVPVELAAQLHTPAGLDIGARSPAEIAVSILAQLISAHHADPAPGRPAVSVDAVAVDPVCGMSVAVVATTPQLELAGEHVYFCGPGCRDRYGAEHAGA